MNRLRDFFEKVLYTGMKPGAPAASASPKTDAMRWLGPLRGPVDRFLSGSGPADPLYLSRRTWQQKAIQWTAIGVPFAVMVTLLFLAATGSFSPRPKEAPPATQASNVANVLPNYKDVELKTNRDVLVLEARLDSNPTVLVGSAKNMTDHPVKFVELIFDLTKRDGSQIGGFSVTLENMAAQETVKFRKPVAVPGAVYVLVREVVAR